MLNNISIVGRLTRDPEIRYTQTGTAVTRMTVAVDRDFKNAQGEKETDFIDVVTWRKLAETVNNHLTKSRLVAVNGRLQVGSWEKNGVKHKAAEIVASSVNFLDRPKENGVAGGTDDDPALADEDSPF